MGEGWPSLALDEWQETRETLHRWCQIVGKVRLANSPLVNHWWNAPLYVTARGLTTSAMPLGGGGLAQIDLDLLEHELRASSSAGDVFHLPLTSRSVAEFYVQLVAGLVPLGLRTDIWTMPVEIPGPVVPFELDHDHATYEPTHVERFWRQLVAVHRVLTTFRTGFVGKVSPVHLFWGGLDMAVTRFSGRTAPTHPGGAPKVGPWVMEEAYSHEVSSAGWWPGGGTEGAFYSYAYPEPPGFSDAAVDPSAASYRADLGEFVLPYEDVRLAADPEATALEFLETSYRAAADNGRWARSELERQ